MINSRAGIETRKNNSFSLTDSDFRYISNFAKTNFGICLEESKKSLVNSRISRRLRDIGFVNFKDYRDLLESDKFSLERTNLLSVLTTNITSFFRERHHFDFLVGHVFPDIMQRKHNEKIEIWSAGCSTGQEPYSIALEATRKMPLLWRDKLNIFATDIDPKVVDIAKKGVYADREMTAEDKAKYRDFIEIDKESKEINISRKIRDKVEFSIINLNSNFGFSEKFDIIFCRNVTIYFDRDTQQILWDRFSASLKPNGYLFVGHSERVSGNACAVMTPVATTTYQKSSGTTNSSETRLKARP